MKILINAFIVFHLTAFALWSNPLNTDRRNRLIEWAAPYLLWTGLWQSWEMFAPNPLSINAHLTALIVFQDGTQATWEFPRIEKLGHYERLQKERYRKWISSYLRLDAYAALWPDTARYIARIHYNPANPPKEVRLNRHWMEVPPPRAGTNHQPWVKEYPHDQSFTFFVFKPTARDFT